VGAGAGVAAGPQAMSSWLMTISTLSSVNRRFMLSSFVMCESDLIRSVAAWPIDIRYMSFHLLADKWVLAPQVSSLRTHAPGCIINATAF